MGHINNYDYPEGIILLGSWGGKINGREAPSIPIVIIQNSVFFSKRGTRFILDKIKTNVAEKPPKRREA